MILLLILLIRPGIVGGTETRRAAKARQFYNVVNIRGRHSEEDILSTYYSARVAIPSMRAVHGRHIYIPSMDKPVL